MAVTTIGLTTLFFGTAQSGSQIVSSYEETIKSEPVELTQGNGTFSAVAFANPQTMISGTIISGTVSASIGSSLSFLTSGNTFLSGAAGTYFIESISRNSTNDGFTETSISAIGYASLGQTS